MLKSITFHFLILFVATIVVSPAYADLDKLELYSDYKFALGVGAAIVKFDTKMKFTDRRVATAFFLTPKVTLIYLKRHM